MFDFPIEKYKFYVTKNKVIAVSTYAGKPVRGVAICADTDNFDVEKGKALAAARCNLKVALKRLDRATESYCCAQEIMQYAQDNLESMTSYLNDSVSALNKAKATVEDLESTL